MTNAAGRAVVFDIDRTLADTNYLHALVWRRVFLEHAEEQVATASIHRLVGMGSDELLEALLAAIGADDAIAPSPPAARSTRPSPPPTSSRWHGKRRAPRRR